MSLTTRLRRDSLVLAASALVIGCALGELWLWAFLAALLGILGWLVLDKWLLNQGTLVYAVLVGAAGLGMLVGLQPLSMLVVLVAALAFWDLDAFYHRSRQVEVCDMTRALEKAHMRRLVPVLGLGFVLALVGIAAHIRMSMGWAILLGLTVVFAIRFGLNAYRKGNTP